MKEFSAIILLSVMLLNSCSPITTPSSVSIQANTPTPLATPTLRPIQTITPTEIPLLRFNKSSFIHLNSITAVHSSEYLTDVWVVGDNGFIAHQPPLGSTLRMDSPEPVNLYDVDFVSSDDGWIVGAGGLILHWKGTKWEISKPSTSTSGNHYFDNLSSVSFTDAKDGWAAGDVSSEGGGQFLIYHWDGTTWTEVFLPKDWYQLGYVHDMVALSSTDVWIVGTRSDEGKETGVTIHWDGNGWKMFSELNSYNIYSMSGLSPDNIWAITRNGIVLNWNGIEWSEKTQLDSADSFSAPVIFARQVDDVFVASNKIWHWNGNNWTDISFQSNLPVDTDIKGIVEGPIDEGGHPIIYMLDSSGIRYWFTYENFK